MNKQKKNAQNSISAVMPLYNASNTLVKCLDSLLSQSVKVIEVILIDNMSTDNSVRLAEKYKKAHPKTPIHILIKKQMTSVGASYNAGIKRSKGTLIVGMHTDSILGTRYELSKLIAPLQDPAAVATYSYVEHPVAIWNTYNFWEKCQHSRLVEKKLSGMNGKFDCYRKDALLKINGFDDVNFKIDGDGSDADVYQRLKTVGKVVLSTANVIHLHHLNPRYSLFSWIEKRRNLAILSGRLLRMYLYKLDIVGIVSFTLRPIIAILPFIPGMGFIGLMALVLFAFSYTPKMFLTPALWKDPRILILPLVNIFLVYFESFWFLYTFFSHIVKHKEKL